MSEVEKAAKLNAEAVLEAAETLKQNIDTGDYDSAGLGLDELCTYAARLYRNLERLT